MISMTEKKTGGRKEVHGLPNLRGDGKNRETQSNMMEYNLRIGSSEE